MANPFNSNGATPQPQINIGQIKNIYNMLRSSSNPNQLIEQMMARNPQLSQTLNLIKSNGNYEQIFRDMCKQRGVNADEFIKQLNK